MIRFLEPVSFSIRNQLLLLRVGRRRKIVSKLIEVSGVSIGVRSMAESGLSHGCALPLRSDNNESPRRCLRYISFEGLQPLLTGHGD